MEKRNWQTPPAACPGSMPLSHSSNESEDTTTNEQVQGNPAGQKSAAPSMLKQWPVQLALVPPQAAYFNGADLILVADCVPFAYNGFHENFLKGKAIVIGCPKLDDLQFYVEKLTQIFSCNKLNSLEVILMEVPCCGGLAQAARMAKERAGADFPIKVTTIGVRGENFGTREW
jgi:hypothetical protein